MARSRPDLVEQWLGIATGKVDVPENLLVKGRAFYEALCSVYLRLAPDRGIELYQLLKQHDARVRFLFSGTGIPLLDYALFGDLTYESGAEQWKLVLEECCSDRELLSLTIAAQQGNGSRWLWETIRSGVAANTVFERARAYVLLGFYDTQEAGNLLRKLVAELPDTWLGELAKTSQQRWQTNQWAKHWFQRFLEVEDDALAWASFRLFRWCVDSRFWHWKQQVVNSIPNSTWARDRSVFLEFNVNDVENRARDYEKKLREQFLGQKILERQAWPWL